MKRNLLFVLALCLCLSACSGGSGTANSPTPANSPAAASPAPSTPAEDDWAYIQQKGELVIGYTLFEPMNYLDENGDLIGFETEFAKAVCEKLGVQPVFQEINWDTKVIELDAKTIDCIWNGMTINEELKQNISISDPYIKNMQVVVIRSADAGVYTSTSSLAGKTVAAEIGSAGETAIQADENLSQASYVGVNKQTDALVEVKAGTSDAAVMDYVLTNATIGEGTDFEDLTTIPGAELSVEEYGIGFRKGSTVTEKVNQAMQELIEDGSLNALAERYGLAEQLIANQK